MSIITFMKEAGERLFPHARPHATPATAAPRAASPASAGATAKADVDALEARAARAIKDYVASKGLPAQSLDIDYDANSSTVSVSGTVPDQETREKIVVCCGNVANVASVDNKLTVAQQAATAQFHDVVKGDTLSAIAKKYYGDANKYNAIFEANRPMLTSPDKIYPGQKLRIPAAA